MYVSPMGWEDEATIIVVPELDENGEPIIGVPTCVAVEEEDEV